MASATVTVLVVGASGETGQSIISGLLSETQTKFDTVALTRPASMTKQTNLKLQERGVRLLEGDITAPMTELVRYLQGFDVVISAIPSYSLHDQMALVDAAKEANVGRFVPCEYGTVAPPGVMTLKDNKRDVLDRIQRLHLPYTVIDVGLWYQISVPRLPSGRLDYAVLLPPRLLAGDGTVQSAITDVRDVGRYVARIIADSRTVNKKVFAYSELWAMNDVFDRMEALSGEKIVRAYLSASEIDRGISEATASLASGDKSPKHVMDLVTLQYLRSWGLRGDNTPENAEYLGYVSAKDLYPTMGFIKFEDFLKELIDGNGHVAYEGRF